jgi:hypothetical protein
VSNPPHHLAPRPFSQQLQRLVPRLPLHPRHPHLDQLVIRQGPAGFGDDGFAGPGLAHENDGLKGVPQPAKVTPLFLCETHMCALYTGGYKPRDLRSTEDMKQRVCPTLWSLLWAMVCGVCAPLLAHAAEISIPPQALSASLQDIARQSGVQIIFFSKVVEGRQARALSGTFEPEAAVATLLEGTGLTYHVLNERTIEVAAVPASLPPDASASAVAHEAAALEEVVVNARRVELSVISAKLQELEEEFYAEYNKLNTNRQYDIVCTTEAAPGSRVRPRVCQPEFARTATRNDGPSRGNRCTRPGMVVVASKTRDYQKHMADVVKKHPELLELLKERRELARHYKSSQNEKTDAMIQESKMKQPRPSSRAVLAALAAGAGCASSLDSRLPTGKWAIAAGLEPVKIGGTQYYCVPQPPGSDADRDLDTCATLGDLRRVRFETSAPPPPVLGFPPNIDPSLTSQPGPNSPEMNPMLQR